MLASFVASLDRTYEEFRAECDTSREQHGEWLRETLERTEKQLLNHMCVRRTGSPEHRTPALACLCACAARIGLWWEAPGAVTIWSACLERPLSCATFLEDPNLSSLGYACACSSLCSPQSSDSRRPALSPQAEAPGPNEGQA